MKPSGCTLKQRGHNLHPRVGFIELSLAYVVAPRATLGGDNGEGPRRCPPQLEANGEGPRRWLQALGRGGGAVEAGWGRGGGAVGARWGMN